MREIKNLLPEIKDKLSNGGENSVDGVRTGQRTSTVTNLIRTGQGRTSLLVLKRLEFSTFFHRDDGKGRNFF